MLKKAIKHNGTPNNLKIDITKVNTSFLKSFLIQGKNPPIVAIERANILPNIGIDSLMKVIKWSMGMEF